MALFTPYIFPTDLYPSGFSWSIESVKKVQPSDFDKSVQVIDLLSYRWKLNLTLGNMTEDENRKAAAFFSRVDSECGLFQIYDMMHSTSFGEASTLYDLITGDPPIGVSPYVFGRSSRIDTLWTTGWDGTTHEGRVAFYPGDYIGFPIKYNPGTGYRVNTGLCSMHRVTAGLIAPMGSASDGSEDTEDMDKAVIHTIGLDYVVGVRISPPMRVIPKHGDEISVSQVPITLEIDPEYPFSWNHRGFKYGDMTVSAREYIPQGLA